MKGNISLFLALVFLFFATKAFAGIPVVQSHIVNEPNEPVPVINVGNPVQTEYYENASVVIPDNSANNFINFPTPEGKHIIIEFVSIKCETPSVTEVFPQAELRVTKIRNENSTLNSPAAYLTLKNNGGSALKTLWSSSDKVKAYSDYNIFEEGGGEGIQLNIYRNESGHDVFCIGIVSGYAVDYQ